MSASVPPPSSLPPGMDQSIAPSLWKRRRRTIVAAVGGTLLVAALGTWLWLAPPANALVVKADQIDTAVVRRAPFQDYLPVRAEVAPMQTVFLGAIAGGQVTQVTGMDGSEVKAGAVLATLANPQLKLDITSREAEIAGRLGDVSAQQLSLQRNRIDRDKEIAETGYNLLKANHDLEVHQVLHDKNLFSDAGLKRFVDEAAYYGERLKALKAAKADEDAITERQAAQIGQTGARLKSNLGVVQSSLDALQIRAPVDGRLTNFTLQPGQTLKAGDQVGQIDGETAYKLTADIDEFYLGRVSPGQVATAEIDGAAYRLAVAHVLPQVTGGHFRAELLFQGKAPPALHRGEAVDLRITLGDTRPALVVANGAWLEGGGSAFVLQPGGHRADRRPVGIGRRNPEQVEVTSGLRPGETIVASSYAGFEKFTHLIVR